MKAFSLVARRSIAMARQTPRSFSTAAYDLYNPSEEHKALREMLRSFVKDKVEPQAIEYNRAEKFNVDLFRELGELGLLGITVPEKYGGSEMDALAAVIAHEELSSSDPAFCLSFLAHSMLFTNNLARNGSDEQCAKYLPAACSGEAICGMAMSEPAVGTDVLGMKTTATKVGDEYVLNGTKMWITNGAINDTDLGDTFLVYARTGTSGNAREDFSSFIVEKGFEGFSLGQRIKDKCGMRASMTAELVFENCRVPAANLIGKEGSAVICMMRNLEIERVTLAAMSLGIARRSIEVMNSYAKERVAFGKPLNYYGQIQANIAKSYAEYMAGRAYTYNTARLMKLDAVGNRVDTDGVKLYCGDMAKVGHQYKAVIDAVVHWLQRAMTTKTTKATTTTRSTWAAAVAVGEKGLPVPAHIWTKLATSIRLRWMATRSLPPDTGHMHSFDLLRAIRDKQRSLERMCFVLNMDELLDEVQAVWAAFKKDETTLVAAVTNHCVRIVELLASELSFELAFLKTLGKIDVLLGQSILFHRLVHCTNFSLGDAVKRCFKMRWALLTSVLTQRPAKNDDSFRTSDDYRHSRGITATLQLYMTLGLTKDTLGMGYVLTQT